MNERGEAKQSKFRFRCCDAIVVVLGLGVVVASLFRQEITFLLLGS